MNKLLIFFLVGLCAPTTAWATDEAIAQAQACMHEFSLAELKALKANQFVIESADERNKIALSLLSCLGHPDPKIRDGIVYEGLSHWLRNKLLDQGTVKNLFISLTDTLAKPSRDPNGFTQSFAALVLSEVLRVDRIEAYLSDKERQYLVDLSTSYMENITDYRGFEEDSGWRHGIAHSADVLLQLSLNKHITKTQLDRLLYAIKTQIAPQRPHFYIYGEPRRLAMVFAYTVQRGEHSMDEWASLLDQIVNPAPFATWGQVYTSHQGLAKLHNTRAFIYSLLTISSQSDNPELTAIQPLLIKAINTLG